jgi:hypothetical protein
VGELIRGGLAAPLVDVGDEGVDRGEMPPMGSGAGGENLDHRETRPFGPVGDRCQQGGESTADALWPGPRPLIRGGRIVRQPLEQPVVSGDEAALLVAEGPDVTATTSGDGEPTWDEDV